MIKKAVVVLSGGLDSTTVLYIAQQRGFEIHALTFDFGQRHKIEIAHAKQVAENIAKEHKFLRIALDQIGGSSQTTNAPMPTFNDPSQIEEKIYNTYTPFRNGIFLSYAIAYAESVEADTLFMGPNKDDYHNYPDCRPEFYKLFEDIANLGSKFGSEGGRFKIETPLIEMHKPEIIKLGISLGVDYSKTFSCYNPTPQGISCGQCMSCTIRISSFTQAGFCDLIKYNTTHKST
jgi:7-cyano-7-deazaguanine synthase